MTYLTTQKHHSKHLCYVNMLCMSLHEIQSDMKRQLLHFTSCSASVAMEMLHVKMVRSLSLSLFPEGVNGASSCLVQHQGYFDVMAIPLPDQ